MQTSVNPIEVKSRVSQLRVDLTQLRPNMPNPAQPESELSTAESTLLRLFVRVEEMRSQIDILKDEVRSLKEDRDHFVYARDAHGANHATFRYLPEGREVELDGESYRAHVLTQIDQNILTLARTKRAGRTGQLLLVKRNRLVRSESLGPLEERILALLVTRRDAGNPTGLNAREIETLLEKESNVLPQLVNSPVDSSIRSSVCRLRSKLARLAGPKGQILTSECGYRLLGRPEVASPPVSQ